MKKTIECEECGAEVETSHDNKRFCTTVCSHKFHKRKSAGSARKPKSKSLEDLGDGTIAKVYESLRGRAIKGDLGSDAQTWIDYRDEMEIRLQERIIAAGNLVYSWDRQEKSIRRLYRKPPRHKFVKSTGEFGDPFDSDAERKFPVGIVIAEPESILGIAV